MPSNHLSLWSPLLLLPSVSPNIRVFSSESVLHIRWPKYWSFSFNISPSNEYSGLISFRIDWLDLLAVQGTLKSLLQHQSSKASILWHSVFFIVWLSHPYMTTVSSNFLSLTRPHFFFYDTRVFNQVCWLEGIGAQSCIEEWTRSLESGGSSEFYNDNLWLKNYSWSQSELQFEILQEDKKSKILFLAQLCPTLCSPIDITCQALLSMGFPRQEYWMLFPIPGDLPDLEIEPKSLAYPALEEKIFTTSTT